MVSQASFPTAKSGNIAAVYVCGAWLVANVSGCGACKTIDAAINFGKWGSAFLLSLEGLRGTTTLILTLIKGIHLQIFNVF